MSGQAVQVGRGGERHSQPLSRRLGVPSSSRHAVVGERKGAGLIPVRAVRWTGLSEELLCRISLAHAPDTPP